MLGIGLKLDRIDLDSRALAAELRGPEGAVHRELGVRAGKLRERARQKVGVSEQVKPHLRDAIVARPTRTGWEVGTVGVSYAVYHHEGTRPHRIQGNPLLVFYWPKVGRVVYLRHVDHPGTRANRFLVDAARELGFRVQKGGGLI
jgi:hypothetical protein